jgi:hypothetical protein
LLTWLKIEMPDHNSIVFEYLLCSNSDHRTFLLSHWVIEGPILHGTVAQCKSE